MVKKTLIGIGATLAAAILVFVIVVAMRPSEYRITRTAKMAAPPDEVFAQVNDFHNWNAWSPWAKLDPNAKYTFAGPTSGVGAKFAWAGNDKVGEGQQEILESRQDELVRINLAFEKPMKDSCTVEFALRPVGEATEVTWSMFGHQNFIGKACCLFMNMDKMVGGDFEKGLANIKAVVETDQSPSSAAATTPAQSDEHTTTSTEKSS
jgi:hypothetical protein